MIYYSNRKNKDILKEKFFNNSLPEHFEYFLLGISDYSPYTNNIHLDENVFKVQYPDLDSLLLEFNETIDGYKFSVINNIFNPTKESYLFKKDLEKELIWVAEDKLHIKENYLPIYISGIFVFFKDEGVIYPISIQDAGYIKVRDKESIIFEYKLITEFI